MERPILQESIFEVLFDKIQEVLLVIDEDGEVLKLNDTACQVLNLNIKDPGSISLSDLFDAPIISKFNSWKTKQAEVLTCKISTDLNVALEFEFLKSKEANKFVLLGKKTKAINSENETDKLLKLLEDEVNLDGNTLGRLLAEESIDKLKLIAENTKDVVCLHHPSDARYLYASPSTKKIMGYTSKDLEGKVPYDYIHPEHLEVLSKNLVNTKDGGNTFPEKLELLFRKKDGNYEWFEGYSKPIHNKKGEVILMLSCTRNIQDRKLAEFEKKEREFIQQNLLASSILLNKKVTIMNKLKSKVLEVEPDVREELRSILNYIKETLDIDDNLEDFMCRFEKIHPDFYNRLLSKNPNLTKHELQLLAFLKLGMTSAEISKIMSIKKESLRVFRYRIKKKLRINENLSDYIARL